VQAVSENNSFYILFSHLVSNPFFAQSRSSIKTRAPPTGA